MRTTLRQHSISLAAVLLCVLMSWGMGLRPAAGYTPIDDLVASVDQLYQAGQIFDVTIRANLIASLQSIGTLIDGGNTLTAKELLTAFTEEVTSLSGVLMTPTAESQLVDGATTIAARL